MSHNLPLLPASLKWEKHPFTYRWRVQQGKLLFRRYLSKLTPRLDLWKFRADFLRTKPTARDFARLLDRYRTRLLYAPIHGDEHLTDPANPYARRGPLAEDVGILAEAQGLMNALLRQDSEMFRGQSGPFTVKLGGKEWTLKGSLTWREGLPGVQLEPRMLLEALVWTAIIDRLRKVRFGLCKQCGASFPITSGHRRKFCSYECAHLSAVRKSRRPGGQPKSNKKQGGKRHA